MVFVFVLFLWFFFLFSVFPYIYFRLESSFRSFSRPVLHSAARVVQEMGKSRAAAFALGIQDIDEGAHVNTFAESADSLDPDSYENSHSEGFSFFYAQSFTSCMHSIGVLLDSS